MFACQRCAWRGPSLWDLLAHPCGYVPPAEVEIPEPVRELVTLAPLVGVLLPAVDRPPLVIGDPPRFVKCGHCGKPIETHDPRKKFCDTKCRAAFHKPAVRARAKARHEAGDFAPRRRVKPLFLQLTGNPPLPTEAKKLERFYPPALPAPKHGNTESVKPGAPISAKASPAKRSRLESMFGATKPAALPVAKSVTTVDDPHAHDVSLEPERLPAGGSAPVSGDLTPNPSHPVRSHIKPANWRQITPERDTRRYCACGMALPVVVPERCPECGRAVSR